MEIKSGNMIFEWDENKNQKNKLKYKVDFRTAMLVFNDENRKEFYDFDHSGEEDRYKVFGKVNDVLVVVYTERGIKTRIITAWIAEAKEKEIYYGNSDLYFT